MEIRPANVGDVDAVGDLLVHLYEAEAPNIVNSNRAGCLDLVRRSLRQANPDLAGGYVIEASGQIVAYGAIAPADDPRRPIRQPGFRTIWRTLGLFAALRYLVGIKRLMLRVCAQLPPGNAQIHSIVVHPAFRGLGLCRSLVDHLESELRRAGNESIMLYVLKGNDVIGLYGKLGYRRVAAGGGPLEWLKHPGFVMHKFLGRKGEKG
jgi:ribosomal protein S18 acetylase RimI-like enzyme